MNKLEFLELDKIELKCQLEVLDHKLEETKNTIRSNNEFVASLHVRQNALVQQFEYFKMALGNLLPIICNKLNMNSPRI